MQYIIQGQPAYLGLVIVKQDGVIANDGLQPGNQITVAELQNLCAQAKKQGHVPHPCVCWPDVEAGEPQLEFYDLDYIVDCVAEENDD